MGITNCDGISLEATAKRSRVAAFDLQVARMPRKVAIIGGGVSGLGVAWALHHNPEQFDFRIYEAQSRIGGNAITVDMPQEDGSLIPFDISVTA